MPVRVVTADQAERNLSLATGFSLTIPEEGIAEVEAVVHQIDERESRMNAASLEELPPRF